MLLVLEWLWDGIRVVLVYISGFDFLALDTLEFCNQLFCLLVHFVNFQLSNLDYFFSFNIFFIIGSF